MNKLVVNCETGQQSFVPLSSEEIAKREQDAIEAEQRETQRLAELKAKAEAKASALAKLQTLGLTEDEATALLR